MIRSEKSRILSKQDEKGTRNYSIHVTIQMDGLDADPFVPEIGESMASPKITLTAKQDHQAVVNWNKINNRDKDSSKGTQWEYSVFFRDILT